VSRIPSLGPRGEGWVVLQLVGIALVVVSPRFDVETRPGEPVASVLRVGGQVLLLASLALLLWGYVELQRSGAFSILPRPIVGGRLVESGPYRVIRNPIYSGLVIGAIGIAASRVSWLTLVAAVVLFVILDLKRRREELWLASRYEDYAAYRDRTKAFVPLLY